MRKTWLLIVLIILLVSFMGCNLKNKQSEKEEISPEKLVDFVVEVAEGKETNNELHDYREISIFKDGVTL